MHGAVLAVVPLKGWRSGMKRLSGVLDAESRERLASGVAARVTRALTEAGLEVAVVCADAEVAAWATAAGFAVLADPGEGLDRAAEVGVAAAGERPWCIVHGDLPLFGPADADEVARRMDLGRTVLCPSRDGDTNVLAGWGAFRFSFGTGSFIRHLAFAPRPVTVVRPGTAIELDTAADLDGAASLPGGEWLRPFVP